MVGEREVQAEDRVIATSQTFKVEAKLVMMVVIMMLLLVVMVVIVMVLVVVMVVTMMVLVVSLVAMATSQTFTVAISNA